MGALGPRLSTVASNLGIPLPSGSCRIVVHTLEDRILTVLRPDTKHCFLQCLGPELLGGILKHTQLQHSPIFNYIVAGQAHPTDHKSGIHGPPV